MKTKRKSTYIRKNPKGKITIKYFVNTRLKPDSVLTDGTETYPLYFKITIKSQSTEIKSSALNKGIATTWLEQCQKYINNYTLLDWVGQLKKEEYENLSDLDYGQSNTALTASILSEKDDILAVVEIMKYDKQNFDIKEFRKLFDMYIRSTVKDTFKKGIFGVIKDLLKTNSSSNSENEYSVLLRSVNWHSISLYDLWLLLKDKFPKVNLLMTKYSLVFSLISDTNFANISDSEFEILRQLGSVQNSRAIKGIMNNGVHGESTITRENRNIRLSFNKKMWDEFKEFKEG